MATNFDPYTKKESASGLPPCSQDAVKERPLAAGMHRALWRRRCVRHLATETRAKRKIRKYAPRGRPQQVAQTPRLQNNCFRVVSLESNQKKTHKTKKQKQKRTQPCGIAVLPSLLNLPLLRLIFHLSLCLRSEVLSPAERSLPQNSSGGWLRNQTRELTQ